MPLKVWNGSAWSTASAIKVWNGTSWASASLGKVWDGTQWQTFHGSTLAAAINSTSAYEEVWGAGETLSITYTLSNTGVASLSRSASGPTSGLFVNGATGWLTSGSAADAQVYVSSSGLNIPSGTLNTWLDLSTSRSWGLSLSVPSGSFRERSTSLSVQIRNKYTLAVLTTATIGIDIFGEDAPPP